MPATRATLPFVAPCTLVIVSGSFSTSVSLPNRLAAGIVMAISSLVAGAVSFMATGASLVPVIRMVSVLLLVAPALSLRL